MTFKLITYIAIHNYIRKLSIVDTFLEQGENAQLVVRVLPISMMSLWSWVRALTEAKENARGLGIIIPVSGDHMWVGPRVVLSQ